MLLLNVSTFLAIVAGSFAVGLAALPARRLLRRARPASPSGDLPMPASRIYLTRNKATGATRLIKASHPDTALRFVAQSTFEVRVANQQDLVDQVAAGTKVEEPGDAKTLPLDLPTT